MHFDGLEEFVIIAHECRHSLQKVLVILLVKFAKIKVTNSYK